MGLADDFCVALGRIGRCIFDVVQAIFKYTIQFVEDVLSWAEDFAKRCFRNIQSGWRMYYVDLDPEEIPPAVIPPERLNDARKVSLGVMVDPSLRPKKVDRVFVHNDEDKMLKEQMGDHGLVELVL